MLNIINSLICCLLNSKKCKYYIKNGYLKKILLSWFLLLFYLFYIVVIIFLCYIFLCYIVCRMDFVKCNLFAVVYITLAAVTFDWRHIFLQHLFCNSYWRIIIATTTTTTTTKQRQEECAIIIIIIHINIYTHRQ